MAQLVMMRPVGAAPLPPAQPVAIREARPADAEAIGRLMAGAFPELPWDAARAHADLFDAPDVPVTYVIEEAGQIVATASVRYTDRFPGAGYVHWVGVDPAHRGRRLGTIVMARVLRRFAEDGRAFSILETDDFRLPAIASYLGQGFIPHYTDGDHEVRWSKVFEQLALGRRTSGAK